MHDKQNGTKMPNVVIGASVEIAVIKTRGHYVRFHLCIYTNILYLCKQVSRGTSPINKGAFQKYNLHVETLDSNLLIEME